MATIDASRILVNQIPDTAYNFKEIEERVTRRLREVLEEELLPIGLLTQNAQFEIDHGVDRATTMTVSIRMYMLAPPDDDEPRGGPGCLQVGEKRR